MLFHRQRFFSSNNQTTSFSTTSSDFTDDTTTTASSSSGGNQNTGNESAGSGNGGGGVMVKVEVGPRPSVEQARIGTEAWIRDVVQHYRFCPFVGANEYKIVVSDPEADDINDMSFLFSNEAINLSKQPDQTQDNKYPATLLVYPSFVEPESFLEFYDEAVNDSSGLVGKREQLYPTDPQMLIYSTYFVGCEVLELCLRALSASERENDTVPFHTTAPWCSILLLRHSDLLQVRGAGGTIGRQIRRRNSDMNEKWRNDDEKLRILRNCMDAWKTNETPSENTAERK
jgi:hypothetical protein